MPRIGDVAAVDMERLVALHPDVVVVWAGGGNPAQREKIAGLRIPIYEQQVARLADIPAAVRRLGMLAGTAVAAERAAAAMEARLAALTATYAARAGGPPSVLMQVWNRPIYTIGGKHLMSDALAICGARNVFADLPEAGPLVDMESIIARDPDIIIAAAPTGEGAAWVADWMQFKSLSAVRNKRVVAFEDQALSRLGPECDRCDGEPVPDARRRQSRKLLNCSAHLQLGAAQQRHRRLQVIALLAGDAHLVTLQARLHLELRVLHDARDLLAGLRVDAHAAAPPPACAARQVGLRLLDVEAHQIDAALGQAQLEDLQHLLELEVHLRHAASR